MAQMQPMSGGKVEALSDITYDIVTELSDLGQAVDVLDEYIDDAKQANDTEAQRLFEQIRSDCIRGAEALRDLIKNRVKQGKF